MNNKTKNSIKQKVWTFFSSIRLSIIIFLLLAATSAIGTFIPQNQSPEKYFNAYGETLYNIFSVLSFFDMYHSYWFQFILLFLSVNLVVCSINRFFKIKKIIFAKSPKYNISFFRKQKHNVTFFSSHKPQELQEIYKSAIKNRLGYFTLCESNDGFYIFSEKWRWSRLGVFIVHLSVFLLLLGGFTSSFFGLSGHVNIPEKEFKSSFALNNSGKKFELPFKIRCDKFSVDFYNSGAPKEYRSGLTIIENNDPVLSKDIIVNDPLRYKGYNIFQSSYGTLLPDEIFLQIASKATKMVYTKSLKVGQSFEIPEVLGKFTITKVRNSYTFKGFNLGQVVIGKLEDDSGKTVRVVLPVKFPNFDKMRKGKVVINISDFKPRYFTGLQITKDPGVLIVYTGFIVMILGCIITFFLSHQKYFIEVSYKKGKSLVLVSGSANKNTMQMQGKIKKLANKLSAL